MKDIMTEICVITTLDQLLMLKKTIGGTIDV